MPPPASPSSTPFGPRHDAAGTLSAGHFPARVASRPRSRPRRRERPPRSSRSARQHGTATEARAASQGCARAPAKRDRAARRAVRGGARAYPAAGAHRARCALTSGRLPPPAPTPAAQWRRLPANARGGGNQGCVLVRMKRHGQKTGRCRRQRYHTARVASWWCRCRRRCRRWWRPRGDGGGGTARAHRLAGSGRHRRHGAKAARRRSAARLCVGRAPAVARSRCLVVVVGGGGDVKGGSKCEVASLASNASAAALAAGNAGDAEVGAAALSATTRWAKDRLGELSAGAAKKDAGGAHHDHNAAIKASRYVRLESAEASASAYGLLRCCF